MTTIKRYLIKYRDRGCLCSVYVREISAIKAVRALEYHLGRFVNVIAIFEVPDD